MLRDTQSLTIEVKFYNSNNVLTYTIPWSANLYIRGAMEACYDSSPSGGGAPFTFGLQYYGTYNHQFLGYMAIAVNGTVRSAGYIWFVYLNGQKTNNSLDAVALNPNDTVEFKYDTIALAAEEAPGSYYHTLYLAETSIRHSLSKYI
jgi:hypothetical protein